MTDVAHRAGVSKGGLASVAPGAVLAGRFRLEQTLGSGGMAEVWRAADLASGREVAVKVLRPQVAASTEAVQRLKREGEVLSSISHPGIVRVETYGELDGGVVFLAMDLLHGETLGARMRRGPMEPSELAPIVAGTCSALSAAHARGIIHRDLKPDNIFLVGGGAGLDPQVKLLDFGIAKIYGGEKLTHTGQVLGTPRYMSPEQLGAEPDVDPRVDVYALGVILYEALAGKPPFLASTPTDLIVAILHGKIAPLRSHRPDLSPQIDAVVLRAMARAREARYATASELAEAFLDAAGATARARALPKQQVLRTQALGGAGGPASVPPPAQALAGTDHDVLRPGTFSAFDAVEDGALGSARPLAHGPSGQASSMPAVAASPAAAAAPGAPPVVAALGAPPAVAPFGSTPPVLAPAPVGAPLGTAAWVPRSAPLPRDEASAVARIALVVGGLLAGALFAAIAMAAYHFLLRREVPLRAPAHPSPVAVAPPSGTPATSVPGPEPITRPPAPPGTEASQRSESPPGIDPPPARTPPSAEDRERGGEAGASGTEGRGPRDRIRRRHGGRETTEREDGRAPQGPVSREFGGMNDRGAEGDEPGEGPDPSGDRARVQAPHDPLERATRALRAGNPEECIEILDDLIARGTTPFALCRRAECLLRAGRRADAIRDYQRFCRIAPDHPAIGAVREQLAGMGFSCP